MELKRRQDWLWHSNYTAWFVRPEDWKEMEIPGGEDNIRADSRRIFCTCKVYYPAILSVDVQQCFCSIVLQVKIYSHQINYRSKLVYLSSYLGASVGKMVSSLIWLLTRGHAQDLSHIFHTHKQELHTPHSLGPASGERNCFLQHGFWGILLSGDQYLTLHSKSHSSLEYQIEKKTTNWSMRRSLRR